MSGTGNRIVASSSTIPTAGQIYNERNNPNAANYQSKQSLQTLQSQQERASHRFQGQPASQPQQVLVQTSSQQQMPSS